MASMPDWQFSFPEPHDSGDGYIGRATGPRRERPGICPSCGDDVPERPFFGDVTCGAPACRMAAHLRSFGR